MNKRKIKEKKLLQVLLIVTNLSKKFRLSENREIVVFEKLNLSIRRGEIVSLLGPNGSGKSTLINLLTGIEEGDSGTIEYNEIEISKLTISERDKLRAKEFSILMSDLNLIPNVSIEKNIELQVLAGGRGSIDANELVNKISADLNIESILKKDPSDLNNLETHQATIAAALAKNPKILFADEFGVSLSSSEKNAIYEEVINYCKSHSITFIIATDDISIASKANRILRFENGKIN